MQREGPGGQGGGSDPLTGRPVLRLRQPHWGRLPAQEAPLSLSCSRGWEMGPPLSPQAGRLGLFPSLLLGGPSLSRVVACLPICDPPSQLGMGGGTTQY